MIKSMTGYGRAEAVLDGKKIVAEIKSLNHRYLETSLRLSGTLAALEMEIKKKITNRFSRGKIEVALRMEANGAQAIGVGFDLNVPLLKNYYQLLLRIKKELNLKEEITLSMMASFRDVFVPPEEDLATVWPTVEGVLDEAVAALMVMREKEGAILSQDLRERIVTLGNFLDTIEKRVPRVLAAYQKRLTERVKELVGDREIEESRLMQEVAMMAEKSDITEEIVRFRSHLDQFIGMLQGDEAVGRKLDFLLQEMGREVNTIGSKSSDVEIARQVIEVKSELARIREQVQNFE